MFMALLAIAVVLLSIYIWLTRGFFSALINLACIIVAGAIAFGVMEPLAYMILSAAPDRGFFSFIGGAAWAIGLAIPFAFSVIVLRLTVDKLLPHNAKPVGIADYLGGAVCGLGAGIITAGIMVMTIGFLRVKTDFMGYQPVVYTGQGGVKGNLQRNKSPIRPYVDELTSEFYERLSLASLRAPTPLGAYHPEFHELPATLRFNFEEGKSRNTFAPEDFTVTHYYTVGDAERGTPMNDLTRDRWHENAQGVIDLDGQRMGTGYLAGFVVRFSSSAREGGRNAQVLATNAQLRLVSRGPDGSTVATHPIAVIAQADADDPAMVRFWYDADRVTATSQGGNASPTMAFEFPVPPRYQPIALYIKGARYEPETPVQRFAGPTSRDMTVPTIAQASFDESTLDDSNAVDIILDERERSSVISPNVALGFTIQKGTELGLKTEQIGRGGYAIIEGDQVLSKSQRSTLGLDRSLTISRFAGTDDTVIVQLDVALNQQTRINGPAFDAAGENNTLYLLDSSGIPYQAIGFIYEDVRSRHIRFTPGQPIKSVDELPALSPSIGDQTLKLIFRCSLGGSVSKFIVGDQVVANFVPPLELTSKQN